MKVVSSCTHAQCAGSSDPREGFEAPGARFWTDVVSVACGWWVPEAEALPVRAWLLLALAWLDGGEVLEPLCLAAEDCRKRAPWALAWAVRAGTCCAVVEARNAGRWPLWRAVPFRLSAYLHPASLAAEVLDVAAEVSGRPVGEARIAWRELARRHGVVA